MDISILRRQGACILSIVCACAAVPAALAAEYPERPVRIISPKLDDVLGQRIVLNNRPGQSGNTA